MRIELKSLGLTDKEIEIYLAGLRLGPATAQELAESSEVKRPTVYFIVDRLKKIGLANQSFLGKKKVFEMAPPEKLAKFIEEEKAKLKKKESGIIKIISSLKVMASKSEFASDIKIYEGYDETMGALIEAGKTSEPIYSIYSSHYFDKKDYDKIKKTVMEFNKTRVKYGGKNYVITDPSPLTYQLAPSWDRDVREYRFLPPGMKLPAMVDIKEDMVALSSVHGKYSCIIIKNKTVAATLKFMFDMIWEGLEGKNLPK